MKFLQKRNKKKLDAYFCHTIFVLKYAVDLFIEIMNDIYQIIVAFFSSI